MKLLPRASLLLVLAACTPAAAPTAPTIVAAPPAASVATAEPAPMPPLDPSLPAGSAALASIDVAQADAILGATVRAVRASDRADLEQALHLAPGALADGHVARVLGLDPARPIVASVGSTGPAAVLRDRLLALAGRPTKTADLHAAFDGLAGVAVTIRVVFPTATDGATIEGALGALAALDRWKRAPGADGFESLYVDSRGGAAAGVSRAPGVVVVDVAIPIVDRAGKAGRDAGLEALRALRARPAGGPHDAPLALDGHPARVRYTPTAIADIGLLTGASAVLRALGSDAVDPAARDEIAAAGMREAVRASELAGKAGRAYFDSIDLALDGGFGSLGFTARAALGPGGDLPAAAWAPAPAIAMPGIFALFDVGTAWARGFSSFSPDPLAAGDVAQAAREAGFAGPIAGLPLFFVSEVWDPMRRFARRHEALWPHVDHITVFTAGRDKADGYVALLSAGTKPADVGCALVGHDAPCKGAALLRPGAMTKASGEHAKLVQVKGRWAVVVSRDEKVVKEAKLELATAPAGRMELPGRRELARDMAPLPPDLLGEGYLCDVALEGRTAVVHVRPVARPVATKKP